MYSCVYCGQIFGGKRNTVGPPYLRVSHPWIQPSTDRKYWERKILESSKKQNLNLLSSGNYFYSLCIILTTIYITFYCIRYYVTQMIYSIWEDVHRLYANTMPFCVRDLSIFGFWYPKRVLDPIPHGSQGPLYILT